MSTTDTTAPAKRYVRFIASGLTWDGTVRRQGHVLAVDVDKDPDGILAMSEKDQRKVWSKAFYEELTQEEYEELAGISSGLAPEPAARPKTPAPPGADGDVTRGGGAQPAVSEPGHVPPPAPAATDPRWPWYEDANVGETLAKVADMPDKEATDFLAWEQAHKARSGVLGPMKGK